MTGFDIIVFLIVAVAAIGGFMRGFVQEVLSLAAWILALFAIRALHTPLYTWIEPYVGTETGAAVLAFALLLLIPYAAMKLIAGRAGKASRNSILGPIDRVLGYDMIWGVAGRPDWITTARTYPVVNASANELVEIVRERRAQLRREAEAETAVEAAS